MGSVALEGFGSGGAALNFKVIGSTTEPTSPKENMIWVNTSTEIISYVFSASQPANPEEGMLWFETAASGGMEFNALKKNVLQVYPVNSSQYISGVWTNVPAKLRRNDEWVIAWDGKLYWEGNDYKEFTGGIIVDNDLRYTENEKSFTVRTVGYSNYLKAHVDNVDLTTYDMMKINITDISFYYANSAGNTAASLRVVQNGAFVKSIDNIHTTGAKEYSIDVSHIKGKADLCIELYCYYANSSVYISVTADKWWLERNQTNISTTELDEAFQNGVNSI